MAAIRLRGIVKRFGAVTVIPPLDLDIRDREFMVIVGPSGCGKSTLLRIIAGLEPLDAGELHIGEDRVNGIAPADRDIAMVFQDYALYPHMTVYDNMAFALEMRQTSRGEIDQRVRRAAAMLRIEPYLDRKPRALSGGQRQRVAMGRAMVRNPRAFLFDEPLSNLDAKLRAEVRTEIKALAQQLKTTMVFVTHDQVEAMTMADRIVILRGGTIQQIGTPEDLYRRPANRFVAGFIGSPAMNFFDVAVEEGRVALADGTPIPVAPAALAAAHASGLRQAVVGVRPEHLQLLDAASPGMKLHVNVVEPLGSDTLLYFDDGVARHVARVPPDVEVRAGQAVVLGVAPGKAHLFAPGEDGVALGAAAR